MLRFFYLCHLLAHRRSTFAIKKDVYDVGYLLDRISFDEMVPHILPMIWEPESLLYYMREELMGDLLLYKRAQLPLYPKWNRGKFKEDVEEYCSFALITHV